MTTAGSISLWQTHELHDEEAELTKILEEHPGEKLIIYQRLLIRREIKRREDVKAVTGSNPTWESEYE